MLHQNLRLKKAAVAEEEEPSIDTDKLSYEIFSILESKFLFGYDEAKGVNNNTSLLLPSPIPSSSPHRVNTTQRGKVCILSIDGVGMRGLYVGKALSYLERSIRNISGKPDARISDYFDLGAGTGTGGIFTAMLFVSSPSVPVYNADDTWRFLAENGGRLYSVKKTGRQSNQRKSLFQCLFGGRKKGANTLTPTPTVEMERSLKETFGEDINLSDTARPVLIPCYDLRTSAPFVFSRADALEAESFDFRMWEVCRATSAELGRFEPVELRSVDRTTCCVGVDGGVAMRNPTAAAITHVLHNKQEFPFVRGVEDLLVLSLGAAGGSTTLFCNEAMEYEKVRRWKEEDWARPISQISSNGAADLVDHAVAMAFNHSSGCSNYVRIQVSTRLSLTRSPSFPFNLITVDRQT